MKNSWRLVTFDAQIKILTTYTNEGKQLTKIYASENLEDVLLASYRYLSIFLRLNFEVHAKGTRLRVSHLQFYSYNIQLHNYVYDIARHAVYRGVFYECESNANSRFAV